MHKGYSYLNNPEFGEYSAEFFAYPGNIELPRLVDPENRPLREVTFYTTTQPHVGAQELRIRAEYPVSTPFWEVGGKKRARNISVSYDFRYSELIPPHDQSLGDMPDAYAMHLFNTIDALIPGSPAPTPGRRPVQEVSPLPTPLQIAAPRRRRTPRG